jgi:hypothetical protein
MVATAAAHVREIRDTEYGRSDVVVPNTARPLICGQDGRSLSRFGRAYPKASLGFQR